MEERRKEEKETIEKTCLEGLVLVLVEEAVGLAHGEDGEAMWCLE